MKNDTVYNDLTKCYFHFITSVEYNKRKITSLRSLKIKISVFGINSKGSESIVP